mmetsp:Transcript_5457/g.5944  ORF Transcript_5457/g.5944 Transcript_5457/m.5944 type:complete len:174 (+) Transcript_5457:80-601(+)
MFSDYSTDSDNTTMDFENFSSFDHSISSAYQEHKQTSQEVVALESPQFKASLQIDPNITGSFYVASSHPQTLITMRLLDYNTATGVYKDLTDSPCVALLDQGNRFYKVDVSFRMLDEFTVIQPGHNIRVQLHVEDYQQSFLTNLKAPELYCCNAEGSYLSIRVNNYDPRVEIL